jgi:hypothetical protein
MDRNCSLIVFFVYMSYSDTYKVAKCCVHEKKLMIKKGGMGNQRHHRVLSTSTCDLEECLRPYVMCNIYKMIRLIRSLKKFIFRYLDLVKIYSVSAEKIINDGCIKIRCQQNCQNILLSICDVKVSLTFTSLSLVLLL